jgi:S1-C subfamily serine protease
VKRRLPATLLYLLAGGLTAGCLTAPPASTAVPPPTTPGPIPTAVTAPPVSAATVPIDPTAQLETTVRGWVFRVRNASCLAIGSSFGVPQGIVTNRHVAGGARVLQLATWDGTDFTAAVEAISAGPDLALLGSTPAPAHGVLATADPPAGTAVWAAGYPLGDQITVVPGMVIDYVSGASLGVSGTVMRVTNLIEPGNSGGPLLNGSGDVVGVVFALQTSTHDGLVIPVSALSQYLQSRTSSPASSCVNG